MPINIARFQKVYIDYLDHNDFNIRYTGKEVRPLDDKRFSAIDGKDDDGFDIERLLDYNKDFTTSYKNNINPGTAEVTIIGINNYTGEITRQFIIDPANINNIDCELSIDKEQIYSGEKKEPVLTIECERGKLVLGKDYEVDYEDNISAGYGKIIITGINNYTDTMVVYFIISPKNLETMGNDLKITIPNQTYTGKKLQPTVTVKDGKTILKQKTDYTVTYINNRNVGTATAKITGKGNYEGTVNKTFKIQKNISSFKVEGISNKTYEGKGIKLPIKLKDGNTELKVKTDYTVTYKNNIDVGMATVTITGRGKYCGSKILKFRITRRNVSDLTIGAISNKTYTGGEIRPRPSVRYKNISLEYQKDYTLSYKNNRNVGTATVIITGKGNCYGSKTVTFHITKVAVTGISLNATEIKLDPTKTYNLTAKVTPSNATYKTVTFKSSNTSIATVNSRGLVTAKALGETTITATADSKTVKCKVTVVIPQVTNFTYDSSSLTHNSIKLKWNQNSYATGYKVYMNEKDENSSYTKIADITNNSTLTYTKNGLSPNKTYYFKIIAVKDGFEHRASPTRIAVTTKLNIANATVNAIENKTYTGSAIKPEPSVKDGITILKNGTDYTLSYKNNTNVGTAIVIITGKGKYSGSKEVTFNITKIAVTKISLNATEIKLDPTKTYSLTATVDPSNATYKTVTFKSSDTSIATVDSSGVVTAKALGEATITATADSKTVKCKVTVVIPQVTNFTYASSSLTHNSIKLKWDQNSYATGYKVYMNEKDEEGSYTKIADITNNSTLTYTKSGLSPNKTYYFKIIAVKDGFEHRASPTRIAVTTKLNIANVTVNAIEDQTYTGSQIKPDVTVKDGNTTLTKNTHYTVSYGPNKDIGKGTVTITGKENYSGSKEVTFNITKIAVTGISLNATEIKLDPTKTYNLIAKVTPSNATYKTVTFKSSNTSIATVNSSGLVTAKALGEATITATADSKTVKCKVTVVIPQVTNFTYASSSLTHNSIKLKWDQNSYATGYKVYMNEKDEEGSYTKIADITNNSTLTYTKNSLSPNKTYYFKIIAVKDGFEHRESPTRIAVTTKLNIANATVNAIGNQTYAGSAIKPLPTVKNGSTILKNGTDYTLSYKNNTNVGTATVTITGKGNYSGTKSLSFNIVPSIVLGKPQPLDIDKTRTIEATVNPTNTRLTWSSSNTNIATVDSSGKITGKGKGIVTITASAGGQSATYKLAVGYSAIQNFNVKSKTTNSITVSWSKHADASKYDLYRSDNNGDYVLIASGVTGTQYTFSGLKANVEYGFKIIPKNSSNMKLHTATALTKVYTNK